MKIRKEDMLLYAVTDRSWLGEDSLAEVVERLLTGGVTCVQLREKDLSHEEFVAQGLELKAVCEKFRVPFIINDNIQVALEVNADGVHIGQGDMQIQCARELLGPDKIIGTSAHNVSEAVAAWEQGVDYLGCGAVFGSFTKTDVTALKHQVLADICKEVPLPVVAIGGIDERNGCRLAGIGVDGLAVISALFAKADKVAAAREMKAIARIAAGKDCKE